MPQLERFKYKNRGLRTWSAAFSEKWIADVRALKLVNLFVMKNTEPPLQSEKNQWFRQWFDSPYYHKLYFNRDEREAAAFINRLANRLHAAPGSFMLDVACGRGRHSK